MFQRVPAHEAADVIDLLIERFANLRQHVTHRYQPEHGVPFVHMGEHNTSDHEEDDRKTLKDSVGSQIACINPPHHAADAGDKKDRQRSAGAGDVEVRHQRRDERGKGDDHAEPVKNEQPVRRLPMIDG